MTHIDAFMLIGTLFFLIASQYKDMPSGFLSFTILGVIFFIAATIFQLCELFIKL